MNVTAHGVTMRLVSSNTGWHVAPDGGDSDTLRPGVGVAVGVGVAREFIVTVASRGVAVSALRAS